MAKDGGRIEIKIGADASELEAELGRASTALAGTAADATNLGDKVDNAADDMKTSAKKMGDLSDQATNTKDEFGELSSGMGAFASALDIVDPRLGAATRALADMSGAAEGAVRLTRLKTGALSSLLPKVGLVGVAVAGLAAGYVFLKRDLDAANASLLAADERLRRVLPLYQQVKMATIQLQVAQGDLSALEAAEIVIRQEGQEIFREEIDLQNEALSTAKSAVAEKQRLANAATSAANAYRNENGELEVANLLQAAMAKTAFALEERRNEALEGARNTQQSLEANIAVMRNATSVYIENRTETERLNAANAETPPILEPAAIAVGELTVSYEDLLIAMGAAHDVLRELDRSSENRLNALRNEGDEIAQLEERRRKALQAADDDEQKRLAATEEYNAARLEMTEEVEGTEIRNQQRITAVYFEAAEDRLEIETLYDEKLAALRSEQLESEREGWALRVQAAKDAQEKIRAEAFATAENDLGIAQDLTGSLAQLGDARLAFLTQKGDEMTDAERDAALNQFEINKALAIAEAGLLAGTASLKAFAQHAGNPILAAAMSALAFSIAGVKTALIAGVAPPSFQEGGIVPGAGATQIIAHGGEGILTASATQSIGGQAGVAALNSGDITGQLGTLIGATESIGSQVAAAVATQPLVVQMVYDNQTFNAFIVDNLRQPNAPLAGYIKGKGGILGLFPT